ncbi:protein yellow-like [Cloeon dipterum]|uniref:protein yellow-like n=1 Tax=Cloeon dipterum TaxID=197152 RepID=UPI0032208D3E
MSPFLCAISILGLSSLATAANFTQVFEWDEMDFEWPSVERRTQALEDGIYDAENILPLFMAVYGRRIFLSLEKYKKIPVTLASLPTKSSASPKLTPFPSWDMHVYENWENCNKIEEAKGLQVDSVGRLWVLDEGSSNSNCHAKLLIFDFNSHQTKLIHHFSFRYPLHDLVLDETVDGTFAYITRGTENHIVVFSLESNKSWMVYTPRIEVHSLGLSPKDQEPRKLYLSKYKSDNLYSISATDLRHETGTAHPELIGSWAGIPQRLLIDNNGTMYAAFHWRNYISSWNTSQPFHEQHFHEFSGQEPSAFTLTLDENGTLWMTVYNSDKKPCYTLLKISDGAKSDIVDEPPEHLLMHLFDTILIGSILIIMVLLSLSIFWVTLRMKMNIFLQQITNEG